MRAMLTAIFILEHEQNFPLEDQNFRLEEISPRLGTTAIAPSWSFDLTGVQLEG